MNTRIISLVYLLPSLTPALYLLRKYLIDSDLNRLHLSGVIIRFNTLVPLITVSGALLTIYLISKNRLKSYHPSWIININLITFFFYFAIFTLNITKYPNYSYTFTGVPYEHALLHLFANSILLFTLFTQAKFIEFTQNFTDTIFKRNLVKELKKDILRYSRIIFLALILFQIIELYAKIPFFMRLKLDEGSIFGSKYEVVEEIKKLPNDSVIVHPPQSSDWPALSNQVILRYYTIPRLLVSGEISKLSYEDENLSEFYLIRTTNQSNNKTWPHSVEDWILDQLDTDPEAFEQTTIWETEYDQIIQIKKI